MSNDARQKNYKHRGLDSEELRKRREDLNITLRKQKREEQVYSFIHSFFYSVIFDKFIILAFQTTKFSKYE
jgi:hypothetical protein